MRVWDIWTVKFLQAAELIAPVQQTIYGVVSTQHGILYECEITCGMM